MTTKQQNARERAIKLVMAWAEDFDISDEQQKYTGLESRIASALLAWGNERLEEAAKKVCQGCLYDLPIEKMDHLDIHVFKDGSKRACQAQAIRGLEVAAALDGLPITSERTGPRSAKHLGFVDQIKLLRQQLAEKEAVICGMREVFQRHWNCYYPWMGGGSIIDVTGESTCREKDNWPKEKWCPACVYWSSQPSPTCPSCGPTDENAGHLCVWCRAKALVRRVLNKCISSSS